MKIVTTRRSDYGIRAAVYLADKAPEQAKAGEIAEAMDMPTGFLHQVLQGLQRGGLVNSKPSRNGGYALARRPEDITVLEIIETLEGSLDAGECALRGGPCHWEQVCALHEVWSAGRAAFRETLSSATLEDLARANRELAAGVYEIPPDTHRQGPEPIE